MIKSANKVIEFGGNGLKFEENSEDRPCIQEIDEGEFAIYTNDGIKYINKEDIDDLIILQEVKAHGYKIDY